MASSFSGADIGRLVQAFPSGRKRWSRRAPAQGADAATGRCDAGSSRSGFRRPTHKKILQYLAAIGRGQVGMANSAMNGPVCFARLRLHPNDLIARLTIRAAELFMGMLGHRFPLFKNLVTIQ